MSKTYNQFLALGVMLFSAIVAGSAWYPVFKFVLWIAMAGVLGAYLRPVGFFTFLALGGIGEALIGFIQFITHKSVGLYIVGESILGPLNRDVARVFVEGGRLLRAYGTFPHPNILAAFLILGLLGWVYFFIRYHERQWVRYISVGGIFIALLGLLITFSRAGWIIIGAVTYSMYYAIARNTTGKNIAREVAVVLVFSAIVLIGIFHWAVVPRARLAADYSVQQRVGDYQRAFIVIKERPLFGHGLTLAMPDGEHPIHNLYLLIATELGLVGLAAFLAFIFSLLSGSSPSIDVLALRAMLLALLLFGLFDHFLWTLRPGLAMLWLVIGLLWMGRARKETFNNHRPS